MRTRPKRKALTFGDFIASVYDTCGRRRGKALVRYAVNSHLLQFQGQQRFLIGKS